jgi:cyclin-dependent kinase 12/13
VVGSGTFGVVFKATVLATGDRVALKKFKLEIDTQAQGFPQQAIREIKILKNVMGKHPNLVNLFNMVTYCPEIDDEKEGPSRQVTHGFNAGDIFMVFEYVDYDLSGLLKCRDVQLTEMHIRSYTKQLLQGISFLHMNKILHRDIKGPNILVTRDNVIKIADLGLARVWKTNDQKCTNANSVVTLWYRSPELLMGQRYYGSEIDIWSVGCLFGEMKVRVSD